MEENDLATKIIGAAIDVHRHLGPGLLESVYRDCMVHELRNLDLVVERERTLPLRYKDLEFQSAYRADIVVNGKVIVELKAVDNLLPVHAAQLLSYLRLGGCRLGLLINFNVAQLKDGVKRVANQL